MDETILTVKVDLTTLWRATEFTTESGTYQITGECRNCGGCCIQIDGDCPSLKREGNKAFCSLEAKPWYCFLFPATRSPDNPLPATCGFTVRRVV